MWIYVTIIIRSNCAKYTQDLVVPGQQETLDASMQLPYQTSHVTVVFLNTNAAEDQSYSGKPNNQVHHNVRV